MTGRKFINTISNLPYFLVGATIAFIGGPFSGIKYLGNTILTVGSSLFHWFETKPAQRLDEIGMYCSYVPTLGLALFVLLGGSQALYTGLILGGMFVMSLLYYYISSLKALPILVGIPLLIGLFHNPLLAGIALVCYIVGLLINNVNTSEHNALHSVWHLLTAIGDLLLWLSLILPLN